MTWTRKCISAVGVLLLTTSSGLFKFGFDGREKNLDALQGECNVLEFHVDPLNNVSCSQCKFVVQVWVPSINDYFAARGWTPAFHSTYRTGAVVVPKHHGFSCCPTRQVLDCCAFYDGPSQSFCDNWGARLPDCPIAPWPCYVKNAREYARELLQNGFRDIPPRDVVEGSCEEWILHIGIAGALAVVGIVVFLSQLLSGYAWKRLPRQKEKDQAAIVIQSWVRGILVRRSHVGQRVKARRARSRTLANRRKHRIAHEIALSPPTEPPPLPGCTTADSTPPIISPLPASQNPFQQYLKDTGSGHRLVQSRIISLPGEAMERLEVALLPTEGPLGAELALPNQDDEDPGPFVRRVKNGSRAEACGLQKGHRLASVGGQRVDATKPWKSAHLLSAPRSELITAIFELPLAAPIPVHDLRRASWTDIVNKQHIVTINVEKPYPLPFPGNKRHVLRWNASLV